MNYEKWNNTSWWGDLYPGDDVIDWIGVDSYLNAQPGGFHNGDFTYLMNRTTGKSKFPGFYTWATTKHPGKPIMVAEWGVYDSSAKVAGEEQGQRVQHRAAATSRSHAGDQGHRVLRDRQGPVRPRHPHGRHPGGAGRFKKIAADPRFNVKL